MENNKRFEFLVPSHKVALEPDIKKVLGDPNMAFPFACCFTKLLVLANLRTAGSGWPESAEGFESLVQGAARLRVRLSARGARQQRRVHVFTRGPSYCGLLVLRAASRLGSGTLGLVIWIWNLEYWTWSLDPRAWTWSFGFVDLLAP